MKTNTDLSLLAKSLPLCTTLFLMALYPAIADTYTAPTIRIPYATTRPILDGKIGEAEWQNAISVNALQTTNKAVSVRQTQFWLAWDEENLYLAMRSPFRVGERPLQTMRERDRDINVVFDDSYEIWLDTGAHSPDGQPVFFQYLSNVAGARYDVLHEPAVGNSRLGWTAGWKPHNRVTPDGRFWEMELAIPRRSLYKETPFTNGFAFRGLLARNFKRPWEQNTLAGTGSFSVRETYARFVLDKDAPGIHLLSVGDPVAGRFGLHLTASAARARTLNWRFRSDSGVSHEGTLEVQPGKVTELPSALDWDTTGTGNFRIQVGEPGGMTYLDWSAPRQWGDTAALREALNDTGERVELALELNPVHDYVRVSGDFINYDTRAKITHCRLEVRNAQNTVIAQKNLRLDTLAYVRDAIALPKLAPGSYTARLTAYDAAGQALLMRESSFLKKDPAREFAWWKTSLGNAEKVLAPWTPVRYKNGQFTVWGRTATLGPTGLLSQIRTQKQDLLASPMQLVARLSDGTTPKAQPGQRRTVSVADHRAIVETSSQLGPLAVQNRVTTEFDGMVKMDLTLTPKQATRVRTLQVVVPLRKEVANYLHACGEGIRYGFDYRFLPRNKTGRIWDSRQVDGQPMRVGSFIPYLWIGNPQGGLCWFADSDFGWTPNNQTPAIEIRRNANGSADLVLNLISSAQTLKEPRRITFAFQATPVKPLPSGWRMDSWWTNDSFQDWAQVESKGNAGNMGLIFSSIPFPLDPAESRRKVAERHRQTNAHIFGFAKYRANAVPYFEHINMGAQFVPEMSYFGEEWRTRVSRGLAYGPTLTDFMVYHVSRWAKDADIDGFYIDNVYPIADDNRVAGRGYLLPDGQVQPTYQMFETRRYFLRLRAAFAEQGKSGKLVLHITNNLIIPWVGAADIALDGEHHVIYPEMNKDFMDFWSLERLRVDYPHQWGVVVNFLQEYQGNWEPARLKKAMRAYTGMMLLHDVLASANANGLNPEVWGARDRFEIEKDDVRFLPYWQTGGPRSPTPNITVTAWQHTRPTEKNALLIAVVNTGEKTRAVVEIPFATLGLPTSAQWIVRDAETGETLPPPDATGRITLFVERHDYRQVLVVQGKSNSVPSERTNRKISISVKPTVAPATSR